MLIFVPDADTLKEPQRMPPIRFQEQYVKHSSGCFSQERSKKKWRTSGALAKSQAEFTSEKVKKP